MQEKKGFFSFFRGINKNRDLDPNSEENKQREYALQKEREELALYQSEEGSNESETKADDNFQEEELNEPVPEEIVNFATEKLSEILNVSGFVSELDIKKNGNGKLFIEIINEEDAGRIIGKEGATLESLQLLLKTFLYRKFQENIRITLDAGNYRQKRQESVRSVALRAARNGLRDNDSIELEPMNAAERRIVHMLFKNDRRVRSFSIGEGRDRHIVLERKVSNANGSHPR